MVDFFQKLAKRLKRGKLTFMQSDGHILTHTTHEEVMFFDTDLGGVMHNLAYLRMVETCRTKLAEKMGMNLLEMAESEEYPVVLTTEAAYKKPAKLSDRLEIVGALSTVERVRFWCTFQVKRESTGEVLLEVKQSLALVQMPAAKPKRLPKEWYSDPDYFCRLDS